MRVVMTDSACEFITPLTLQAVSGHPVYRHLLDTDTESGMGHIELARWADMVVIAPATANFIAKIVSGRADDLLATLVLASTAELAIAPAMNQQMWQNTATQENLEILRRRGFHLIGPAEGDQACGEMGLGRMSEPNDIAQQLLGDGMPRLYAGKHIVVTAGPTWEAIDPVRGITNLSSGKMGYAMASAAHDLGARVTLVSGPVHLSAPAGVSLISVLSAQQMLDAVMDNIHDADIYIGVAAVSDYRPSTHAGQKIKKTAKTMIMELVRNPDILATVASMKNPPFTIGFAAETEKLDFHARSKLLEKGVNIIVGNNVSSKHNVFGSDSNSVKMYFPDGEKSFARDDKYRLSVDILDLVYKLSARETDPAHPDPCVAGAV